MRCTVWFVKSWSKLALRCPTAESFLSGVRSFRLPVVQTFSGHICRMVRSCPSQPVKHFHSLHHPPSSSELVNTSLGFGVARPFIRSRIIFLAPTWWKACSFSPVPKMSGLLSVHQESSIWQMVSSAWLSDVRIKHSRTLKVFWPKQFPHKNGRIIFQIYIYRPLGNVIKFIQLTVSSLVRAIKVKQSNFHNERATFVFVVQFRNIPPFSWEPGKAT